MSDQSALGLGKIITSEQQRDAIHVAVLPVTAGERLKPGDWISLGDEDLAYGDDAGIGIVDPFLKVGVKKGQRFWLYLIPGSITSLRHVWTHPACPGGPEAPAIIGKDKEGSERWLRNFIDSADCPSYDRVMAAAIGEHHKNANPAEDPKEYPGYYNSRNDGEYLHFGGHDAHGDIPAEFWDHVEIVTGKQIPNRQRARYFSCSC